MQRFYENIFLSANSFSWFHLQRDPFHPIFSHPHPSRYLTPGLLLPFLLSPFLPYKPSACIVALSKDRFDGDDDDGNGDDSDVGRKHLRRSSLAWVWIFLIFSVLTRRRKALLLSLASRRKKENRRSKQRRCIRDEGRSHPSPNLVKHTGEIKRPCADVVYDLGAI